ncbi:MAG: pyridoxamine 5'-phosphate oxidase family protein [Solirubrobacterales bacterium]
MTSTLPPDIQSIFDRFITTEYTTVDRTGQPITWPVTPYHDPRQGCIDITTGLGYPKKARDAQRNPKVSLLFSDPTGSGLDHPAAVLVQGIATVDERDLAANRDRYRKESVAKLPATRDLYPPEFVQRFFDWYFVRVYVHVRPERVFVWPEGDFTNEPQLLDSHLEEVRSHHSEEPEVAPTGPDRTTATWDARMSELGSRFPTAALSLVGPDGFPISGRAPIRVDHQRRVVRVLQAPTGVPLIEGRACLTAHAHDPQFRWQTNFQVRGNLVQGDDGWLIEPHRLVGGFELPPGGAVVRWRANARKVPRFRRIAKREMRSMRAN